MMRPRPLALMKILGHVDVVKTSDRTFLNLANRTAERLTEKLSSTDNPSKEDIDTASFLADHGFIQSLGHLSLENVNFDSIYFELGLFTLILCVHGSLALRNIEDDNDSPTPWPYIRTSTLVHILKRSKISLLALRLWVLNQVRP